MKIPAPPYVEGIKPYVPGKPIQEVERELGLSGTIKMASNENPLGPSPAAVAAVRDFLGQLHIYPEGSGYYCCQAIGDFFGVPLDQIILGNGSVELVEMAARAFLSHEANCVMSEGSFAMYPIACQVVNAPYKTARMRERTHDLAAMLDLVDERTRLILIANPNNPTGTYNALRDIEHFMERVPSQALVIVDEAYKEFVQRSDYGTAQPLLERFSNLMVLGTFSKAYGLAALRIGYGFAHPDVISTLHKVRSPFNTSSVAQVAAIAALKDQEFVARYVALNETERAYLTSELKALGLRVTPSVANFVLVDVPLGAGEFFQRLLRQGVIVRPMAASGFPNSVRVTVYTRDGNDRFIAATRKILGR